MGAEMQSEEGLHTSLRCQVEARLTMCVRAVRMDGGLSNPPCIFTGYRNSHVRFDRRDGSEHIDGYLATFRLTGRERLYPGETGLVLMEVLGPGALAPELRVGGWFEVLEDWRVAEGVVTAILSTQRLEDAAG